MLRGGNKYSAKKTPCQGGHTHASKREAVRCNELTMLARAGVISDLEQQPQFWFAINGVPLMHDNGRRVGVKLDFRYVEQGRGIVEDSKGMTVRDWPLRKAVFQALYPDLELREV